MRSAALPPSSPVHPGHDDPIQIHESGIRLQPQNHQTSMPLPQRNSPGTSEIRHSPYRRNAVARTHERASHPHAELDAVPVVFNLDRPPPPLTSHRKLPEPWAQDAGMRPSSTSPSTGTPPAGMLHALGLGAPLFITNSDGTREITW